MSSVEGEFALVVLVHRKRSQVKTFGAVTIRAIYYQPLTHELPVVIILMAIGTPVVLQRGIDIDSMAGGARNIDVLVFQLEIRFGMIEIVIAPNDEK